MSKIYARGLAGKEIVTAEGRVLGELENIILDSETGKLIDLVVDPEPDLPRGRYRQEGKFILVSVSSVSALKDRIIVEEGKAQK